MESTMQNNPNTVKNTVWITVGAIIIIILLIWGGVYMYNNRPLVVDGENASATSTSNSTTTRPNLGEDDREVTVSERALVTTYMQTNINRLSSRKAAAGRSFTVDMVIIEAAGRAIVEYSDGVSSYTAAASYSIDSSGNVVVNSFENLEK